MFTSTNLCPPRRVLPCDGNPEPGRSKNASTPGVGTCPALIPEGVRRAVGVWRLGRRASLHTPTRRPGRPGGCARNTRWLHGACRRRPTTQTGRGVGGSPMKNAHPTPRSSPPWQVPNLEPIGGDRGSSRTLCPLVDGGLAPFPALKPGRGSEKRWTPSQCEPGTRLAQLENGCHGSNG